MDLDTELLAMGRDPDRQGLGKGLTQDQLHARFGYVRPLEQVSPYLQRCRNEFHAGDIVVFLRDSPWMVVMDSQRKGSEIVLCKGH